MSRLRAALPRGYAIEAVHDWADIEYRWRTTDARIIVLDPDLAPSGDVNVDWAAGSSLVLYTAFTPDAIRRALAMTSELRGAPVTLALRGQDDSPMALRSIVERALTAGLCERLVRKLEPQLAALPSSAQRALLNALRSPVRFRSVETLASDAGVTSQTLRRWTHAAAVSSPKTLLIMGRVAWAYQHLRAGSASINVIAEKLAYGGPRDLGRHVRQLLEMSPRELRLLDEDELFTRLSERLGRP